MGSNQASTKIKIVEKKAETQGGITVCSLLRYSQKPKLTTQVQPLSSQSTDLYSLAMYVLNGQQWQYNTQSII